MAQMILNTAEKRRFDFFGCPGTMVAFPGTATFRMEEPNINRPGRNHANTAYAAMEKFRSPQAPGGNDEKLMEASCC